MHEKSDKWAIDGTIMKYKDKDYCIWSGWEGNENCCQNLYIAEMDTPYSFSTERVMISTPEYAWEKLGSKGDSIAPYINEGAYAFSHCGKQYLTYSAAGSWCTDYSIALLELTGEDPLKKIHGQKCRFLFFRKMMLCKVLDIARCFAMAAKFMFFSTVGRRMKRLYGGIRFICGTGN